MRLLPKSIHRCRRYPTKFNSGRDIPHSGAGIDTFFEFGPIVAAALGGDADTFDLRAGNVDVEERPSDLPPFSSTTRKQKIHETWPSCNASTSKLSGC